MGLGEWLTSREMSQSELGRRCGWSASQVNSWSVGRVAPSEGSLEKVVESLGLDEAGRDGLYVACGVVPEEVRVRLLGVEGMLVLVRSLPEGWVPVLLEKLWGGQG